MSVLKEGDLAPAIKAKDENGELITLEEYRGKKVVLYFYPKDDTPGCTKEAIGFTDMIDDFAAADTVILGVSKDSVKKHDKFVAKHELKIALLSDEDGDVCERYGTWVEKNMYGKKFMGIVRTTYLIDGAGTVVRAWPRVKVAGHAQDVLDAVRAL